MQREIKRKTALYGVTAILLAALFTTLIFNFGVQPFIPVFQSLDTFASFDELEDFVLSNMETAQSFDLAFDDARKGIEPFPAPNAFSQEGAASDYSKTNIQVAGVDEADIVKTDGIYLYVIAQNKLFIIKAYPAEDAEVVSEIVLSDTYNLQMYIEGDNLVVLGGTNVYSPFLEANYFGGATVTIFDISDRTNPVVAHTLRIDGTLSGSRKIENYMYITSYQPATVWQEETTQVVLPKIVVDKSVQEIEATQIRYVNVTDAYYYFTTIMAIDITDPLEEPASETFLTGAVSNMYVSLSNMYLTVPNTNYQVLTQNIRAVEEPFQETMVYRVQLQGSEMTLEAEGAVPGYILNQFSMDEFDGYFRIATTTRTANGPQNNVYILDMALDRAGQVEELAPGETIYAARFLGDRCYLVTFVQIDPLFVIDLSNPTEPEVLGELKIPGYSDYLHPFDETTLIGIGKEAVGAQEGSFAWYQGVKIALFDVSIDTDPQLVANYTIGDRGSDSPILWDHKAFLLDRNENLLVIPVLVAEIHEKPGEEVPPNAYGTPVWQGAYVFTITPDALMLKGTITHQKPGSEVMDANYWINRTLYIKGDAGNVLYTVSNNKVQMNNIEDLVLINEVSLP